jgi:hypothetical protein
MRDPNDRAAIQQDLQRYRELLKRDALEEDARRMLHQLVKEAEERLAEIEGHAQAH